MGALQLVLTHELFHFAARADTALDAPRWLLEGAADFVARPDEPLPPRRPQSTELPTDAGLDADGAAPGCLTIGRGCSPDSSRTPMGPTVFAGCMSMPAGSATVTSARQSTRHSAPT